MKYLQINVNITDSVRPEESAAVCLIRLDYNAGLNTVIYIYIYDNKII